jgi:hypothetical protein
LLRAGDDFLDGAIMQVFCPTSQKATGTVTLPFSRLLIGSLD